MKWIITASCLLYSCSSLVLASPKMYVGAGAGNMFYNTNGNNYLSTGASWPDDQYITTSASNQPYGFIAAGYAWQRDEDWLPEYDVGLRYMYVADTTLSGYINQYSLPGFRNYNFSYDVQILNLMAVLKTDIYRWQRWRPYIIVGAGIASYGTSNYSESALSGVTPRVSPAFSVDSGNNFAYQLGLGIDYAIWGQFSVGLECDYFNFGTVSTGKGTNYATLTDTNYDNEALKNPLWATTLLLSVTYHID